MQKATDSILPFITGILNVINAILFFILGFVSHPLFFASSLIHLIAGLLFIFAYHTQARLYLIEKREKT